MGVLSKSSKEKGTGASAAFKMISDYGDGFYSFDGKLYSSDIVRSCIRPKVQAVGKAKAKHIRGVKSFEVNPEPYMRFLLEEPNAFMSGQMLQEQLVSSLMLNNNAFCLIARDDNGLPSELYPISAISVELSQNSAGELFLRFYDTLGEQYVFKYADVIHLRRDFRGPFFGERSTEALTELMNVVTTLDQGVIKAVKNSNVITWLLKFNASLREEDIKRYTKNFVDSYLSIDSGEPGAAAVDAKFDAQRVEPKSYVPEWKQSEGIINRIYNFFNTNAKIIQSLYSENDWISYYEAEIEPVLVQMSEEFTRKLFSRRERGFGNRIIFESSNLTFASMQTKMNLVQLVDRGIMCPDEVRAVFNMPPVPNGEGRKYIRRLDTAEIGGENE